MIDNVKQNESDSECDLIAYTCTCTLQLPSFQNVEDVSYFSYSINWVSFIKLSENLFITVK